MLGSKVQTSRGLQSLLAGPPGVRGAVLAVQGSAPSFSQTVAHKSGWTHWADYRGGGEREWKEVHLRGVTLGISSTRSDVATCKHLLSVALFAQRWPGQVRGGRPTPSRAQLGHIPPPLTLCPVCDPPKSTSEASRPSKWRPGGRLAPARATTVGKMSSTLQEEKDGLGPN